MSTKYSITYTLNGITKTKPVHPIDGGISLSLDCDNYIYSENFSGKYAFKNIPSDAIYDFDLLKSIEEIDPFTTIIFKAEKYVNNQYIEIKQGRFVLADCDIDNDLCVIEVQPQGYDDYTCLNDIKDTDYNWLLEVEQCQSYMLLNPAGLEFFECSKFGWISVDEWTSGGRPMEGYNGRPVDADNGYIMTNNDNHPYYAPGEIIMGECFWHHSSNETVDNCYTYNLYNLPYIYGMWRVYKTEFIFSASDQITHFTVPRSQGNPISRAYRWGKIKQTWCLETTITLDNPVYPYNSVPPSGSGWLPLYQLSQGGLAATKYGRQPFYNAYAAANNDADWYINSIYKYQNTKKIDGEYFLYELLNPYTNYSAGHLYIYRGRLVTDVIQMFLNKANCGLTLKSEFLQSATNPVTGDRNPVYVLNDASDIKQPNPTAQPATINYLTFQKLMDNLTVIFDLCWYISGSNLIIEHRKYFENGLSYVNNGIITTDLRGLISKQTGVKEIIKTNKYTYDVKNIYKQEKWNNQSYIDYDFSPLFIDYDLHITKDNNTLTRNIDFILDISGVYNNPSNFSNDGIVITAIREDVIDPLNNTTAWVCINELGYRTGEEVVNGWMCISNLFNRFWRSGRIKEIGTMNAQEEQFESEIGRKLQKITIKDCDLDYFKNKIHFTTDLGTGRKVGGSHKINLSTTELEILI